MLKIIAPVNAAEEVDALVGSGARELYCGVLDSRWNRRYSPVASPNRREWRESSMRDFKTLENAVLKANDFGVPVALTLNAQYFSRLHEKDLIHYVDSALSAGVEVFFVSDLGLILLLKERYPGVKVHLSSVASASNSMEVEFYRRLGVSRINLPRHLEVGEIKSIVRRHKSMEFEAMLFYGKCFNIDGSCTFHHGPREYGLGANGCELLCKLKPPSGDRKAAAGIRSLKKSLYSFDGYARNLLVQCGLCALYDFNAVGLHGVKVIGRGKPLWMRLFAVRLAKTMVDVLEEKLGRREFMAFVRDAVVNNTISGFRRECTSFNCYYPSLM